MTYFKKWKTKKRLKRRGSKAKYLEGLKLYLTVIILFYFIVYLFDIAIYELSLCPSKLAAPS